MPTRYTFPAVWQFDEDSPECEFEVDIDVYPAEPPVRYGYYGGDPGTPAYFDVVAVRAINGATAEQAKEYELLLRVDSVTFAEFRDKVGAWIHAGAEG